MGNGFASVRKMYLPMYADTFAREGVAALTIDYPYLGESEGGPRQQVIPEPQIADMRNAITWLSEQPGIDPQRIALWGTSFAGGHVLRVASHDPRVAAAVAQVRAVGLWRYLRLAGAEVRQEFLATALADRLAFADSGEARMLAITAPDGAESVLGDNGYDWHRANEERHPSFRNEIAAHSLDHIAPYDPGAFVEEISPTPLLMIVARQDTVTAPEVAREVYERIREPKQLVEFDGDYYDVYDNAATVELITDATAAFLRQHLGVGPTASARAA
jgi:hypothetical protein